jgi:hypothetical protein
VIDISNNPRVSQLVGRVEEVARDLERLPAERADGERRIGELYLEMGRYVHWLIRQDPAALARVAEASKAWSAEADAKVGPPHPLVPPPLAAPPARLERPPEVAAPEPPPAAVAPPAAPAAVAASAPVPAAPVSVVLEDEDGLEEIEGVELVEDLLIEPLDGAESDEASAPDEVTASDPPETAWVRDLHDLIAALGPPEQGRLTEDQSQRAANRLLNATTQMEMRWMGFPDSVQHALLAVIGCRARNLQDRMPVDVELRMALGRMRRFHGARRLPSVRALEDDARPEHGSWEADSARWWKLLDRGV